MTSSAAPDVMLLRAKLHAVGQDHLLKFFDQLTAEQQTGMFAQILELNLESLPRLIEQYVKAKPAPTLAGDVHPAPYYGLSGSANGKPWDRAAYKAKGEALIRAGKVAAFTVAGGQGSRLGYEGPKGCYPAGAVTNKPLFACLADWILAAQRRYCPQGVTIPWYVMTSPINHEPTVAFFRQHAFFGLREQDVMFFPQGVMPSLEMSTGRILLNQKHELALNPDGHGGSLKALFTSGAIDDMERRGVEQISYTQIDNPLVRVIDPTFLGLHAFAPDSSGQMSSKMVPKAHAGEKVGVLCRVGKRTEVIEYSDLPESLSKATDSHGVLRFIAGSIAVHVISVAFVKQLNAGGAFSLPYHRAEKKVGYVDLNTGQRIVPTSNNAVKLETFVFDALPLCESSIVVESDRIEEFAPIKNAEGADSPASCRQIQTQRAARWLAAAGCRVPMGTDQQPQCVIELSPLRAMESADLKSGPALPQAIAAGASVVL